MNTTLLAQLSINHEPVERLYPGWEAVSRHSAPGGMDIVLFREHETGHEACWWVTPEGNYLASHALALKPEYRQKLINALAPVLQPIMDHSLIHTPQDTLPTHHPTFQILISLPETALMEVIGLWFHHAAAETVILSPEELLHADPPDEDSPFAAPRIRQLMESRYHDNTPPIIISPFSSLPLKSQLTMQNHAGTACRFYDPTDQLTFYLFWPHPEEVHIMDVSVSPLFYYPQGPLILGTGHTAHMLPTWIMMWFLRHPEHPQQIQDAPAFQLEDYGLGNISTVWNTFSTTTEQPVVPSHLSSSPEWTEQRATSKSYKKNKDSNDDNL